MIKLRFKRLSRLKLNYQFVKKILIHSFCVEINFFLAFFFCSYVFPSIDELANQLDHVLRYFGLQSIVGLGVGAGGNILARFAYRQPTKVI